jgi:hypothetical protein
MTTSDWIAVIAVLVALLTALYTRWVWNEARTTNLLALHVNRLEVYRAFNSLRQAVQERGVNIAPQHVALFYNPSQEAKFYFSEPRTSKLLRDYFDTCWKLTEQARKLDRTPLPEAERAHLHEEQDRLSRLEESQYAETKDQIEKELCHAVTRKSWKWCCL